MSDETMNYLEAIRLVLKHGARVRRLAWDDATWRRAYDIDESTRVWVSAVTGKMFGIETGQAYKVHEPVMLQGETLGETGFRLYQVRHPSGPGYRHVLMDWNPSLADTLADDWVVCTT